MVNTVTSQPEGKKFESTGQLGSFCVEFVLPVLYGILSWGYPTTAGVGSCHPITQRDSTDFIFLYQMFSLPGQPKTFLAGFESVIKMLLIVISMYVSGFSFFIISHNFVTQALAKHFL